MTDEQQDALEAALLTEAKAMGAKAATHFVACGGGYITGRADGTLKMWACYVPDLPDYTARIMHKAEYDEKYGPGAWHRFPEDPWPPPPPREWKEPLGDQMGLFGQEEGSSA